MAAKVRLNIRKFDEILLIGVVTFSLWIVEVGSPWVWFRLFYHVKKGRQVRPVTAGNLLNSLASRAHHVRGHVGRGRVKVIGMIGRRTVMQVGVMLLLATVSAAYGADDRKPVALLIADWRKASHPEDLF